MHEAQEEVWAEGWIEVCDLQEPDVIEALVQGKPGFTVVPLNMIDQLDGEQFPCGSVRVRRNGVWHAVMPSGMDDYMSTGVWANK